jgi:hypothetical protein
MIERRFTAAKIDLAEQHRRGAGPVNSRAIDNGKEIAALQAVLAHGFAQNAGDRMLRTPGIKQRDFATPVGQKDVLQRARRVAVRDAWARAK